MLLLIDLAFLDERVDLAEAVDTEADVLQDTRIVPGHQLGPDDPGVRSVQLLDEQPNGARIQRHIVVEEAEEAVVTLDQTKHLVGDGSVAEGVADSANEGIRNPVANSVRHVAGLTDDQEQALQIAVVLVCQPVEHLVEPIPWFEDHHHGHDGRSELTGGFHEAARLVPGSARVEAGLLDACNIVLAIVSTVRYIDCTSDSRSASTTSVDHNARPTKDPVTMYKLPDFSSIEFPSIDFPGFDLSKFDLSQLDLAALRNIDVSKYVPNINLSTGEAGKLTAALRDAAYITVGLGVVAVEQAQARRRQLVTAISDRFGASKTQVETLLGAFETRLAKMDEQVDAVEARLDMVVDKLEGILPEKAGALFGQARDLSKGARKQVRGLIRTAA